MSLSVVLYHAVRCAATGGAPDQRYDGIDSSGAEKHAAAPGTAP
jgi:hypothetical protein